MKHKKISTILSVICMGLGQFYNKSFIKGILFLLVGISFILNVGNYASGVWGIFTLGETPQSSVGFDVVQGDHSIFLLLEVNCSALKCFVRLPVSILTGQAVEHKLHVAHVSIPSYWYKSLYSFAS